MRNLLLYFLASVVLCSCQNKNDKMKDEDNLKHLLGVSNLEYKLIYELDELESMNEGIYIASILLTDKSFQEITNKIKGNKTIELSPKYIASSWKSTPTEDVSFDIFNYSPTTKETKELLYKTSANLKVKGNFFFYTTEKDYIQNMNLYVLDVSNKRINIYQTYF